MCADGRDRAGHGWLIAGAAVCLLACDPGVFDRDTEAGQSARVPNLVGIVNDDSSARPRMQTSDAGATPVTSGTSASPGARAADAGSMPDGAAPAAANGGTRPGSTMDTMEPVVAGAAALGQAGAVASAANGGGGAAAPVPAPALNPTAPPAANGGASGAPSVALPAPAAVKKVPCPRVPASTDESFCYDFESGVRGPNAGDTYDLWPNPELATSSQLAVVAQPDATNNQVLQTLPRVGASDASAALGHSTRHFERATAEFDFWANDALLGADEDVSWFRFVPVDGDDTHVTALLFRRGQALLRSESSSVEYPLSKLPRSDGKPTHVSLHLERGASCSVVVSLDGEQVASAPAGACMGDSNGFVEYGLVMLDTSSGALSASYDDVAFTRE